ncbi:metallophosphoesterase [Haladaptatus pallidirubidus]|uniref:Metallophosphoesterase n=1 Tax=Haladaptatus pallidirubidus TaxID=1008152 RepID=A0AAV3UKI0_9EURY|nr:metallophosphoesterase [Haladaptatus pallidirubidus]
MEDAEFADRAVFLPEANALVLADLHIGRDATSSVSLPLGEQRDLATRFAALLHRFSPAEVVLAGDVLHAFDRIPEDAEDTFAKLKQRANDAETDFVAIRGNHDNLLSQLVDCPDEYRLADGTLVCHGHEEPDSTASRYVVGHDHPAIEIEGKRRPCYLWGPGTFRGSDVLVLPAFTRLAGGAIVNGMWGSDFQTPFVSSSSPFRPIVRDEEADETYRFPPLGEFRELL